MIRRLLDWLFRPSANVQLTKRSIEDFFDEADFGRAPARIVRTHALELARDSAAVDQAIVGQRISADELGLVLIANTSKQLLVSGRFHRYRGMLTMLGTGIARIYADALNAMLRRRYISEQDLAKHRRAIANEIAGLG